MKVVFFGTPEFAAKTLEVLLDHQVSVVAVVTQPDRPRGRKLKLHPSPVKELAQKRIPHVPILQPEKASSPESAQQLAAFNADLFVVVAFGEIIKENLLQMPPLGCINVHASLLPKYRGAAPIQRCLMEGEQVSGVSIMFMAKAMDAGDLIATVEVPISDEMTAGELEVQLCEQGARSLVQVLDQFQRGTVSRYPQDHGQASYAPKLGSEDCQIRWELPGQVLYNLIRGTNPRPGAWTWVNWKKQKKRLKVMSSQVIELNEYSEYVPGQVMQLPHAPLVVKCGRHALSLRHLQMEGKCQMPAEDFVRGFPLEDLSFFV